MSSFDERGSELGDIVRFGDFDTASWAYYVAKEAARKAALPMPARRPTCRPDTSSWGYKMAEAARKAEREAQKKQDQALWLVDLEAE